MIKTKDRDHCNDSDFDLKCLYYGGFNSTPVKG